jgi:hypothetical protein
MTLLARALPTVVVLFVLTAGCLGAPLDGASSPASETSNTTPTSTPAPSETASPDTETTTATPFGHEAASKQPDPDKAVRLENRWNRSVELSVRVVRDATNRTVHDETYELPPGEERTVYSVSEANPEGVESFTVVVTARNTTERVSIETNACYGDAYAEIQEDGTLYLYYAIC